MSNFRRRLLMALGPSVKPTTLRGRGRIHWNGRFNAYLPKVKVYGEGKQDGTPAPDNPIEPVFLEDASVVGRGKNLLNIASYNKSLKGPYWYYLDGNFYQFGGKPGDQAPEGSKFLAITGIRLAFHGHVRINQTEGKDSILFSVFNEYGNQVTSDGIVWKGPEFTLTVLPKKTEICLIAFKIVSSGQNTMELSDIQLEYGSTPTPYEPYIDLGIAPLPILRALPDGSVRDEMDVVSGTVVRRIQEVVFDGTEKYGDILFANTAQGNLIRFFGFYSIPKAAPVCNYYQGHESASGRKNGLVYYSFAANAFDFMDDSITSREDAIAKFKALYNAGTPVTVWYALATPIIEHYDPAVLRQHPGYTQLIQQGGFRGAEIEADVFPVEEV